MTGIPSLHQLRGRYDAEARRLKLRSIEALDTDGPRDAQTCAAVHDALLFVRAFPDSHEVWRAAAAALAQFEDHVRSLPKSERRSLDDSGMVGTTSRHTYSYGAARWLASRAEKTSIDWRSYRRSEQLDSLLRHVLHPLEVDAFESGNYSTRQWVELAAGEGSDLRWLLCDAPGPSRSSYAAWSTLYDVAELPVAWDLSASRLSTSLTSMNIQQPVPRAGFRRLPRDPVAFVGERLEGIRRLEGGEVEQWHEVCAASLAARCREVLATFEANRDETYLADLGEGVMLCIFGLERALRLPIEANYGYVMVSNGVPIGYGGVTPLGPQANTGINIFEPFRGSEAALLFAQALRAFATLFGVGRFVVNPYQFGKENEEGIASGAYWFYDRLGFRPRTAAGNDVRDRERARHEGDPTYRSDAAALAQLATEDLVLTLAGWEEAPFIDEHLLTTVGASLTRALAGSSAAKRIRTCEARVWSAGAGLVARPLEELSESERFGLRLMAPLLAALPSATELASPERASMWDLVRLKGERQERAYAAHSASLWSLWSDVLRAYSEHKP